MHHHVALKFSGCRGFSPAQNEHLLFVKSPFIDPMRKNVVLFGLALLAVVALLYAGVDGLSNDHSYGFFFTFTGAITTVGLGLDVVNHLRIQVKNASVRKLGRM